MAASPDPSARRGEALAIALDTLVEDVHFPVGTAPFDVGYKAMMVNLSDLAAMGAWPSTAFAVIAGADGGAREAVRRGGEAAAGELGLDRLEWTVVAGEAEPLEPRRTAPAGSRASLTITLQAAGHVDARRALRRDGAQAGDLICVSGTLGDAAAGLALHEARTARPASRAAARATPNSAVRPSPESGARAAEAECALRARLDRPTARVALGFALLDFASAAIDISDGLLADLQHVLRASRAAAQIDVDSLPLSPSLSAIEPRLAPRTGAGGFPGAPTPLQRLALCGGDDYELCFCIPRAAARRLAGVARKTGVSVTVIGEVVAGPPGALALRDAGGRDVSAPPGFEHFARGAAA